MAANSPKNPSQIQSPLSVSTTKNLGFAQKKSVLITNSKKHILTDGSTPKHRQILNLNSGSNTPSQFRKNNTKGSSQNSFNDFQAGMRNSQPSIQEMTKAQEIAYYNQLYLLNQKNQVGTYIQSQISMPSPVYGPRQFFSSGLQQQNQLSSPEFFMPHQMGVGIYSAPLPTYGMMIQQPFINPYPVPPTFYQYSSAEGMLAHNMGQNNAQHKSIPKDSIPKTKEKTKKVPAQVTKEQVLPRNSPKNPTVGENS